MVSALTGCQLHDHNCGFKVYRREVLDEVGSTASCTGSSPSWPTPGGSGSARSRSTTGPGKFGPSKYGVARFIKGLLDLLTVRFLTRFGQRPLHVLGALGLALLALGGLGPDLPGGPLAAWATGRSATGRCCSTPATLLVVGTQLVSLGILAELVTSYNIRETDTYSIAETLEPDPTPTPRSDATNADRAIRSTSSEGPPMDDPPTPEPGRRPGGSWPCSSSARRRRSRSGLALRMPTQLAANDISRWCTVWSLLERGTYAIDDCPWQKDTQDKVKKPEPFSKETPAARALLFEQAAALADPDRRRALPVPEGDRRPARRDRRAGAARAERREGRSRASRARPSSSWRPRRRSNWPAYVLYLKPVDRPAQRRAARLSSWSSTPGCSTARRERLGLVRRPVRGRLGDVAVRLQPDPEQPHGRRLLGVLRDLRPDPDLEDGGRPRGRSTSSAAGFFGAFCACNELPAALVRGRSCSCSCCPRSRGGRCSFFVPAAVVPLRGVPGDAVPGVRPVQAGLRGVRHQVVQVRGELLEHPAGDRLVQQAPRAEGRLPVPHDASATTASSR